METDMEVGISITNTGEFPDSENNKARSHHGDIHKHKVEEEYKPIEDKIERRRENGCNECQESLLLDLDSSYDFVEDDNSLSEDENDPSYKVRPIQWWRDRYEALSSRNGNLYQVACDVYAERKAICPDDKKGKFFYCQVAAELVEMTKDKEIPSTWRESFLRLCNYLAFLSVSWNAMKRTDEGKDFQKEILADLEMELQGYDQDNMELCTNCM